MKQLGPFPVVLGLDWPISPHIATLSSPQNPVGGSMEVPPGSMETRLRQFRPPT
jgi:hypothetical protein